MARVTEFTVTLQNRPGTLADTAEALGNAGVNIDGLQAMPCEGRDGVQLVAGNPDGAARALDSAGLKHTRREVLLISLEDKPGALARVARAVAKAGINIDAAYVTMSGKVVLGVDKLAGAEDVLKGLGVT